jgi:hypothetical protein
MEKFSLEEAISLTKKVKEWYYTPQIGWLFHPSYSSGLEDISLQITKWNNLFLIPKYSLDISAHGISFTYRGSEIKKLYKIISKTETKKSNNIIDAKKEEVSDYIKSIMEQKR